MDIVVYGIARCDACCKARRTLERQGLAFRFHDFRADGLDRPLLERMEIALGWDNLLNRRSTTWRELPEPDRAPLNRVRALELMLEYPTLIKRPVIESAGAFFPGLAAYLPVP
ncbi:arsenate reductase [Methylococcus geothermalis]|uniref:Arsenate reductase n=1 Tax=Methylococcus geothermalis TaxID=2681310 RepID=A0A858Q7T7_9GAMM|nr:arsenate reductase [Methylococcus geothermalis]QJD29844.1 arsenate reductase [Methylococcus geothermalis]